MRKITMYIWQLGVNIIGLPELFKVEQTQEKFILKGKGTNKDVFVFSDTIKYLGVFFGALLLIGCGSFEKRHFKAVKFFNENESLAAEYCSGKFPSQTEYIKGDEIIVLDTILSETIYAPDCPDGTKVECPKNKTITKTIRVTDTLRTPDLARERVLNDKINNCNADNVLLKKTVETLESEIKVYKHSLILAVILLLLCVYLLIKRK